MSYFHLAFGIFLFAVFVTTGRFMNSDFPDKEAIPQELRLLMRSRHIYILFSALIHLSLGAYLRMRQQPWRKRAQFSGTIVLTISSFLLIWAFVAETYTLKNFSDISRYGIYTSLAGIGLHLLGGFASKSKSVLDAR